MSRLSSWIASPEQRSLNHQPHKFDPAKAARLDLPERQQMLPNDRVVDLLDLRGSETVVDYGAGSGVLSVPVAERLPNGTVHAVDESPEMLGHLEGRLGGTDLKNVHPHLIQGNHVDLEDGSVDRVLAVNLLHEVLGEGALEEMRRLLRPDGFLLVVDWRADVEREPGPPADVSLTPGEGRALLERAGFEVAPLDERFPYHFAFKARPLVRAC
ncbi:MAG: class I SAM-dependent methyltransferase [Rubrobacteraceae bacterium]